jgi:hypothetical protein
MALLNHDEKVVEELWPCPSKAALHRIVDSMLINGVIVDEMPIENYRWEVCSFSLLFYPLYR